MKTIPDVTACIRRVTRMRTRVSSAEPSTIYVEACQNGYIKNTQCVDEWQTVVVVMQSIFDNDPDIESAIFTNEYITSAAEKDPQKKFFSITIQFTQPMLLDLYVNNRYPKANYY